MIIIMGLALIIAQCDINIPGIMTGVGLSGVAFTFIAKDTLTNIMSFRSTRIRTFEQGLVIVPNTTLSNDNILNWSTMPKRRAKFTIGVTYDTPKEQLEYFITRLKESLKETPDIEKDTYLVYFNEFGPYSLDIVVMYYTFNTRLKDYTALKEAVN